MINSNTPKDRVSRSEENKEKLYAECVREVYRQRSQNLLSHVFVSGLPLYLGWASEAWLTNLFLLSLLWAYILVGYYFTFKFNASLSLDKNAKRWGSILYYQLVAVGIFYNLVFLNLHFNGVENAMLYLLLTTALFSSGAVSSYQHLKWLGPVFVVSAMTPQCIYYFNSPGIGDALVAGLIVVFIAFMANVGLNLHKNAMHSLSLNHELIAAKEDAELLARTDVLTELNNRRAFFEMGKAILGNARRQGHPLSVVMLDIDKFKKINDTHGHATGDEVIKAVANALRKVIRESDISGRLGGEEFAVILQETNRTAAQELAERLRKEIQGIVLHFEGQEINTTASFGISQYDSECNDLDKLIAKADLSLYQAKEEGRNRVVVAN